MNWLFAESLFRLGSKSPQYASYVTHRRVCHRRVKGSSHAKLFAFVLMDYREMNNAIRFEIGDINLYFFNSV